jgi:hypothetical protein
MAAEKPLLKPRPTPEPLQVIALQGDLVEPFDLTRFPHTRPVKVAEISPWLQMQIDAGLMRVA